MKQISPLLSFLSLTTPIILTLFLFWPGLTGDFLFDDYANFQGLANLSSQDTLGRIMLFIFNGTSGPTGRPISLASFIINDYAWPTSPYSFKYTNLMIHILCGILVYWLVYKLTLLVSKNENRACMTASICMLIWLTHPVHVSTVLYVIQRMTQLSTLFSLAAILGYLYGRIQLNHRPRYGYIQMSLSLIIFGLLSLFSKETALLIPVYILTIEYFLLRPMGLLVPQHQKYWNAVFLWIPFFILLAYFASIIWSQSMHYGGRSFTLSERLMTEFRVVSDYIKLIILPYIQGKGIFHDDYIVSKGLLNPVSTLASILFILTLLISAFTLRKRWPLYSFSIIWFFAGQMLESTFPALELYIEHRNYLPSLGPIFGITYLVVTRKWKYQSIASLLFAAYISIFILITAQDVQLWGNPIISTAVWAEENPNSVRAQQAASNAAFRLKDPERGRQYLERALKRNPKESGLILQLIYTDCYYNRLSETEFNKRKQRLKNSQHSNSAITTMIMLSERATLKKCPALTADSTIKLLDTLINNPSFQRASSLHALHYWKGMIYGKIRQLNKAMNELDTSFHYAQVIDIPLQQSMWLVSAGLFTDAKTYLYKARQLNNRVTNPLLRNTRKKDLDNLAAIIRKGKKSMSVINKKIHTNQASH